MKSLEEIDSFGSVDADNDEYLLSSFEDHEAYLSIIDRKRYLVIGRKGAGKTAIYKKIITTRSPDFFPYGHTFSDYPWHYHQKQARIGIPDFDKFTHSWKYLILLSSSKIILNQDQSLPFDNESMGLMLKIESFVVDSYGTRDPDLTQIFSPSKRLSLKPAFNIDFGVLKAGVSPQSVPIEELPVIVQDVNKSLSHYVLSCLNPDHRYFICFDQLDLGFDPGNPDYANRLIGLILAARDLNLLAREYGRQFLVGVFLRDDIYNELHFEDKNKITENFLSLIEWDTTRTSRTLRGLMEKRFKATIGSTSEEVLWTSVFDETHELPGHQTKYNFILDRTFSRPRDIIKFCNCILSKYKQRLSKKDADDDGGLLMNQDVHDAREDYGTYFLKEVDDEIHKHIPAYKAYIEIIKSLGVYRFSREEFIAEFEKRKDSFGASETALSILKLLYEFSLIGFYKRGGKGFGGSEYIFRYKDPSQQFDETSDLFQVHLGLMDVLGLKKYEKK